LFDEGHNLVSMNLPKAIKNMNQKILQEAEMEKELLKNLAVAEAIVAEDQPLDVEYDLDYDNEMVFKSIPTMDQRIKTEEENKTDQIRVYSINTWNGSPGLKSWDHDDDNPEK
jgi:hypothetical protein